MNVPVKDADALVKAFADEAKTWMADDIEPKLAAARRDVEKAMVLVQVALEENGDVNGGIPAGVALRKAARRLRRAHVTLDGLEYVASCALANIQLEGVRHYRAAQMAGNDVGKAAAE